MVDSPGPQYDTTSLRHKPVSVPKDVRSQYLARAPEPSPTRAPGDYNLDYAGNGTDRLMVYPSSTFHHQPGAPNIVFHTLLLNFLL
jgi:hypothetical protein